MLSTDSKGDIVYLSLTDIGGNAILRDQRSDSSLFNKLYTGHHYDQVTNLTYAHARYLDTRSHSFLSVDPMYYELPSSYIYNPQSQNSYSYANNNTVVNTDPTGLWSISSVVSSVRSHVSSIVSSVKSSYNTAVSNVKSFVGAASSIASQVKTRVTNSIQNSPTAVATIGMPAAIYNGFAGLINGVINTVAMGIAINSNINTIYNHCND